ncbi:MAG: hypothetical protein KKC05_01360 [Nanoarchaeota archaeon]|nr:hypothetical protein [Nanoarchaeota archaeon]
MRKNNINQGINNRRKTYNQEPQTNNQNQFVKERMLRNISPPSRRLK